jgi:methylmalonyl-CoA/ethylmalonyl-CoA epimerase
VVRRIHHVGIVVSRLTEAYKFYRETLRLPLLREATLPDQGVRAALLGAGETEIELLEPLDPSTGVARFLARRGEGLHHLCFDVASVEATLAAFEQRGVELIDTTPRSGLAGRVAFLHPRACAGVLVELATPSQEAATTAPSPLQLKRLVVGTRDPRRTAALFQALFALSEVAMNGGRRIMLAAGQGALLMVPADEVGGTEGMVALSFVAEQFPALTDRCHDAGVKFLRGTGEVTIEPVSSHGVHLHISRYRFP